MAGGLDAVRYAGASARVKGLYSHLLSDETWESLVSARDADEAVSLLGATAYGNVVSQVTEAGTLDLEPIERGLLGKAAASCLQTAAFMRGPGRDLVLVWWQHFELQNIKAIFRGLDQGMAPSAIVRFLVPLGDESKLPWDALLHEHSVSSLIERLNGTHYINPLRAAFPAYQRDGSLFPLEVAMDIRYYRDIAAVIKRLTGAEQIEARRLFGSYLDMLNILWAFRYRVYYGLSAEEIINYTLWHAIRTDTTLIRRIALGADPREVLAGLWGEGAVDLSRISASDSDVEMMPKLELALYQYWRRLAQREMTGYPFRLGVLLGYLILQELEVRDVITILEGKGMKWSPKRIQQHLIWYED